MQQCFLVIHLLTTRQNKQCHKGTSHSATGTMKYMCQGPASRTFVYTIMHLNRWTMHPTVQYTSVILSTVPIHSSICENAIAALSDWSGFMRKQPSSPPIPLKSQGYIHVSVYHWNKKCTEHPNRPVYNSLNQMDQASSYRMHNHTPQWTVHPNLTNIHWSYIWRTAHPNTNHDVTVIHNQTRASS
jgi:hypothetical protein